MKCLTIRGNVSAITVSNVTYDVNVVATSGVFVALQRPFPTPVDVSGKTHIENGVLNKDVDFHNVIVLYQIYFCKEEKIES